MARVLVTGASGFVGRAAVAALAARGHELHAVARTPDPTLPVARWHAADLLDPAAAAGAVRAAGASHLLHAAWTTVHGRFWDDPANADWERATAALAEAFGSVGGERIVLVGTCAQYDWTTLGPSGRASEATTPRDAATPYGRAKQAAGEQLHARAAAAGLSSAAGLLFFPYGPRDQPGRLVPSVARSLLAGQEARISAGTQVRDFVHVDDCGAALAALVDDEVTGDVNVGSGVGTSVADVARAVARIVGREDLLRVGALAGDDGTQVVADVRRLRDEVGFAPAYDLEAGLRQTVEWWRALS